MNSPFGQVAMLEEDPVFILEESLRDAIDRRAKLGAAQFEEQAIAPAREALTATTVGVGDELTDAQRSVRATAHYNLGVVLSARGMDGAIVEDLQEGASELRKARDDYNACSTTDSFGLLRTLINLGVVRFREAKLLNEGEPLGESYDSFEAAATLCVEAGETLWLAKVRYNQGQLVLFTARSNPDSEWFGRAAEAFELAGVRFAEAGDAKGELRSRVHRAVSLAGRATVTRKDSDLQEAIESNAAAADLAARAGDRYLSGSARFHHMVVLCRKVELSSERAAADVKEAVELADGAADDLRAVGAMKLSAAAEEMKRFVLEELAPGAKFDNDGQPVPSKRDDTEQQEGRIAGEPVAGSETFDVGADFAGAVGALKSRLIPIVTDHDITQLEAVLREAQQSPPADKVGFVRDMRRMLEAGGLNLEIEGVDAAVNLSVRNGSLAFVVARQGGRSFKNTEVRVVRADVPEFAPRPPRGALETTTEPS